MKTAGIVAFVVAIAAPLVAAAPAGSDARGVFPPQYNKTLPAIPAVEPPVVKRSERSFTFSARDVNKPEEARSFANGIFPPQYNQTRTV